MTDLRDAVAKIDDPNEGTEAEKAAKKRIANYEAYVARMAPAFERAMTSIPKERLVRIAITAARNNPGLTECTPLSVAGALLTTATLGLEPNTSLMESFLVPYKNHGIKEAQLIIGYQGFVKLFFTHPKAANVSARAVYPGDDFDYAYGTGPFIDHQPMKNPPGDRGEPTHYYATVLLTTGASHFEVLTAAEVKELRKGKVGPNGDIPDPMHWMEKKTAIRQVLKLAPKTVKLANAIEADEQGGGALYKAMQQAAVRVDVPEPETIPGQIALEINGEHTEEAKT